MQEGKFMKIILEFKEILHYVSSSEQEEDLVKCQHTVSSSSDDRQEYELPVEVLLFVEAPLQEVVEDYAVQDWLSMQQIRKWLYWQKKGCIGWRLLSYGEWSANISRRRLVKFAKLNCTTRLTTTSTQKMMIIFHRKAYACTPLKILSSSLSASLLNSFLTPFRILLSIWLAFQLSLITLLASALLLSETVESGAEAAERVLVLPLKRLERSLIINVS